MLQDKLLFLKVKILQPALIMEFMRSGRTYGRECGKQQTIIVCIALFILLAWPAACRGKDDLIAKFVSQDQGRALTIFPRAFPDRPELVAQLKAALYHGQGEQVTLKADAV